jgi:hypothetical protein
MTEQANRRPRERRDPLVGGSSGRVVDPGFRRDDGLRWATK